MIRSTIWIAIAMSIAGARAAEKVLTPEDKSIRQFLSAQAAELERDFFPALKTKEEFEKLRPMLHQQYLEMQGLWPLPEKTPLNAKTTGKLDDAPDYTVELVHYQSKPGLYVTANLFLPKPINGKYPAILYQCGHSNEKRDGNKTAYQDWGIWFARHGYVALVTDSLQLGEIAGIHHGTYREGRWWWHSLGYTPAGVECWNAIRGLDYLCARPEVDAERIGATGISGGGSATMWISAADERVKASAPVSGMSDLGFYIGEDGVDGHCDCMFVYNRARWNWTNIPALICPRPLLFVNSDNDGIFPMSGNNRVINRLSWLYARFGEGDKVSATISVGGHGYRTDLRREIFEFFNRYLKHSIEPVTDPNGGLASVNGDKGTHFIEHARLRVFPSDADVPADAINTRADRFFITPAKVDLPTAENFAEWKTKLLARLREMTFNAWPPNAPSLVVSPLGGTGQALPPEAGTANGEDSTEPGLKVTWRWFPGKDAAKTPWLIVLNAGEDPQRIPAWTEEQMGGASALLLCPRGVGTLAWTRKNPPNTVEREFPLLGGTVDGGRIWDIMTVAKNHSDGGRKWHAAGTGQAGILAAYAGLYEPSIEAVTCVNPPASHFPMEGEKEYGPPLLNVLRVLDIPEALGCLAPKGLHLAHVRAAAFEKTAAIYKAAGAEGKFTRE
ncbi:MAG TPA: prolyl oligopeptidase family serine peptidase [Planctomycetota bacterium]|nr:prolyl oligopeptidase family serine peptidase [Planctomycetota bacterium]